MHSGSKLLTLVIVAGSPFPAMAQAPSIRDSAGIQIVENVAPFWTRAAPRHLEATPAITLGVGSTDSHQQFGWITGAVRLGSGEIVIGDESSCTLSLFDAQGAFIRTIGRKGEGPGDLQSISTVFRLPGDVILVWDEIAHRLTWFTRDAKVPRTLNVDRPPQVSLAVFGPLGDNEVLASRGMPRINPPPGMRSDSLLTDRVDSAGHIHDLLWLLRGESWQFNYQQSMFFDDRPFTVKSSVATENGGFWYTDGLGYELREFGADGKLRRIVRERRSSAPVTASEIAAFKEAQVEVARTERLSNESHRAMHVAGVEAAMAWVSFPKQKPAFAALKRDPAGNLWAREYGDSTQAQHWDLFDRTGRLLGTVDTPAGLEVLEIGTDYLLGKIRDQDDVEGVRMYRFAR